VRLLETFRNVPVRLWDTGPFQLRQFRHAIRWPQVSPDNSAILASQVGCRPHFAFECIPRRFVRHIHAGAVCVEFPAMIDASKTTVLVTPPEKAGSAVRTKLVKESDAAVAIAEGNEILTHQPNSDHFHIPHRP